MMPSLPTNQRQPQQRISLLVEPDARLAQSLGFILRTQGWEVVGASCAAHMQPTLAAQQCSWNQVALVLLHLPQRHSESTELLQQLFAINRSLPVLLMVDYGQQTQAEQLVAHFADHPLRCLDKPFSRSALLTQLNTLHRTHTKRSTRAPWPPFLQENGV
jgi:DNA-binding response OmpR family regulator